MTLGRPGARWLADAGRSAARLWVVGLLQAVMAQIRWSRAGLVRLPVIPSPSYVGMERCTPNRQRIAKFHEAALDIPGVLGVFHVSGRVPLHRLIARHVNRVVEHPSVNTGEPGCARLSPAVDRTRRHQHRHRHLRDPLVNHQPRRIRRWFGSFRLPTRHPGHRRHHRDPARPRRGDDHIQLDGVRHRDDHHRWSSSTVAGGHRRDRGVGYLAGRIQGGDRAVVHRGQGRCATGIRQRPR